MPASARPSAFLRRKAGVKSRGVRGCLLPYSAIPGPYSRCLLSYPATLQVSTLILGHAPHSLSFDCVYFVVELPRRRQRRTRFFRRSSCSQDRVCGVSRSPTRPSIHTSSFSTGLGIRSSGTSTCLKLKLLKFCTD